MINELGAQAFNLRDPHIFAVRLMEHLVVPTFVLNAYGEVMIWNRACERLTGVSASDVIGTKDHWRAFYETPRLCLADILAMGRVSELDSLYPWHAAMSSSGSGLRAENWCVMPQVGKRLYLAIDAGPIYDHEGELIAVIETLRDITEQKQAQLALETIANRDGLTELANRRAFDLALRTEFQRGERNQAPLALMLGDVDRFKQYNDLYGHPKGDDCLKAVADAIGGDALRSTDIAARYGGEEFAVIMPGTTLEGAHQVAERIRSAIWALALPHGGNPPEGRVTISLGIVSVVPTPDLTPGDLLAAADQALYAAKQGGRNRVADCQPIPSSLLER